VRFQAIFTGIINLYPWYFKDRSEKQIKVIEAYLRATKQLRNYKDEEDGLVFSQVVSLDLGTVVSSVSGPKRPNDRVSVSDMKNDFLSCLTNKVITILICLRVIQLYLNIP